MPTPSKSVSQDFGANPDSGLPQSPHTPVGSVAVQPIRALGDPIPFPLDLSPDSGADSMPASPRTPIGQQMQNPGLEEVREARQLRRQEVVQNRRDELRAEDVHRSLEGHLRSQPLAVPNTPRNRIRSRVIMGALRIYRQQGNISSTVEGLVAAMVISGRTARRAIPRGSVVFRQIMNAPSPTRERNIRVGKEVAKAFNDRSRFYRCSEGGRPGPR
jgi:hypothetical protein